MQHFLLPCSHIVVITNGKSTRSYRCIFGLQEFPCTAAHNYFFDFEPVVNISGLLELWPDDACDSGESSTQNIRPFVDSTCPANDDNEDSCHHQQDLIVFVRRGGCSFASKVQRLIAGGGVGAVVIVDSPLANADTNKTLAPDAPGLGDARGINIPGE